MAIPLSLVRAKLLLFGLEADRRDFVCIAVSCGTFIVHGRLFKADELNRSYLSEHSSEGDGERTQSFKELRELARLLLCPKHKEELCEETARAWEERRPDNDLLQLFKLNRNPFDWTCLAERCVNPYNIKRRRALTIMEALTFNKVAESRLSDERRGQLVRELVGLLHCDNRLHRDEILRISDKWNKQVTNMIQRQESAQSSGGLFGRQSESGGIGQSRGGGLFGAIGSGSSSGGLFGSQSGSAGAAWPSSKVSSGSQFGSGGVESSSTGFPAPQFNFSGSGSSNAGSPTPRVYSGGSGSPSSSVMSKLVSDGNPAPPSASQSESLNSGLLSPNSSPPSSRKSPASTAEQTETASPGVKGPWVSTAEDQARHSSSSRRTASPLSKPSPADGAQGGSPVTNGLGHSLSAVREAAKPRSHSSSNIRVSGQQPHDNRPSPLRETQSYPDLHSEGPTRGPDPEEAVPTEISSISTPLEEEEIAIFSNKSDRNFEPREIDMKLLRYIRSTRADYGQLPQPSSGDVYVLRNPAWPNHVKIGESGRDVDKRITEIKGLCKIECLEQALDTEQDYFPNYKLVEKLCHKELQNLRKTLHCKSCRTKKGKRRIHEEWFQVTPEIAVRTVQKWRKWMLTSPYNDNGHLVPWWRHKANGELIKAQPLDAKGETIDDDDNRHERWSRWLESPTISERADFEIKKYLFHPRPRRKSLWNTTEENLIPLLTYVIVVGFLCGPKNWILIVLSLLSVLRDWY